MVSLFTKVNIRSGIELTCLVLKCEVLVCARFNYSNCVDVEEMPREEDLQLRRLGSGDSERDSWNHSGSRRHRRSERGSPSRGPRRQSSRSRHHAREFGRSRSERRCNESRSRSHRRRVQSSRSTRSRSGRRGSPLGTVTSSPSTCKLLRCRHTPRINNISVMQNIIQEFDPNTMDVDNWLNSVDEYCIIHGWDDKTVSHLALGKLRGVAETWYRGLPTRLFSWPEWADMIRTNFRHKRNVHQAMKELLAFKAKRGDSLYEYLFKKLSLIHKLKLPINDEDQVQIIIGDIENDEIKFSVEAAGINKPHLLAAHFKSLDI